ncbi:MAG: hypothetical protein QXU11_09445 [Thermoproteota archaeon]
MSKHNRLSVFLSPARTWPICLVNAAIAYFTIAGLLLLLAPDIAELTVNRVPTIRLILSTAIAFLFHNMLLVLTYAASLFIVKRESIIDGFRRNSVTLIKGFALFSTSNIACLLVMFSATHQAILTPTGDVFKLVAMNSGAGLAASFLLAIPLVWLMASLSGEEFRMGFRFLAVVALVFLMLTILSTYGLPGLFIDSMFIPTVVSLVIRREGEKADDNGFERSEFYRLNRGSMRKKVSAILLSILIISTEAPFNTILVHGEESRFSEDRLKELVSKAVAEGWGNEELANAIKSDPGLSMLSTYDLSSITIERDDAGNVEVNIPLNAAGYAIYRKTGNKTTVYDVYAQTGLSEVRVGDRRYVLAGYRGSEEIYGPFETLDDALAKEGEVKAYANATRITSKTVLKTETREAARIETKYAIVPTVRVAKYEVLKEFETQWDAENYLYCQLGMLGYAEIREVERKTWVYSYRLVFERETRNRHEAMTVARDEVNYMVEEVRERIAVYVFNKHTPLFLGPIYLGHYPSGEVRIRRDVFEKMLENGMVKTGRDLWGLGNLFYYYASEGDAATRIYKVKEEEEQGDVIAWKIYRRIDTSHYETKRVYRVVVPNGYEERKISIGDLPSYAKGFASRGDAENSRQAVEQSLRRWVESQGMTYRSCEAASYEETVSRIETVAGEVKQYYVAATFLKPVYDVYELQPYYKVWNETSYEEAWGWVFKGCVEKPPETYDVSTWVYSPEVANWTSKTYLEIVTEWEAQVLMSTDPRYVAEKHNTTTITREVSYYDVYNATWKLLYHYYKYVVHPVHEYIANGNISSGGGWVFENLGDASGEISGSTYRSSPSSLRITTGNGRGAWRQTFYYDVGGSNPMMDFWYILRGSGVVAIKKPDGSAQVFTLGGSSGWVRFHRDSGDVFNQAGYYTISFVASENSELIVDDVSVHVGGYGEWVYRGDVENKPENVPPDEKYEAFYRIENKRLIGTFDESVANQYPTPPYIKEFRKKETVSYTVDLYKLYYLEGGLVRYRVFHWEKQQVPIVVRKEETGAKWILVESGVETDIGQRVLVEYNAPESIVKAKYNDPTKYLLVPKIVDSGEALELVCETLDENLARKYEKEGYVVNSARVSAGNPIRFSMRLLQASIERNEMGMLGKQNNLRVSIANPTSVTLTYRVVLEAENEERVEKVLYQPHGPEAVKRVTMVPVAEPSSWLLAVPPGGAQYSLGFTAWIKETEEREYESFSRNVAYWPEGSVGCSFIVKALRNGKLVAKQRVLETFENFDVGRTLARHPFETVGGFLTGFGAAALLTALSFALTPIPVAVAGLSFTVSPVTIVGLAAGTASALIVYAQTGGSVEALTYSPLGIILAPVRALADPTMDDSRRASIIGAMVGAPIGVFVGQKIGLDVAMLRMPGELRSDPVVYGKLYGIESNHGTQIASAIARSIGKLYPHLDAPDAKGLVTMILSDALASRREAFYIASMLEWASRMSDDFLRQHAGNMMEWLGSPLLRGKLASLLQLSPDEALQLSQSVGGDFARMLRLAEFKQAFDQLAKLGPDAVRMLSWSPDGIEVGVEKNLATQLYPSIQKGSVVEFEFARGSIVLKGFLTYADEKTLGDTKYLVFAFKAEEKIPAVFNLLKEDIQAIPGRQVEKTFSINTFTLTNGKPTLDRGMLSIDGSIRLSHGTVLRLEDPGIRLVPSENPLETGTLNNMLPQGRIGGTSIIVNEDGSIAALHGETYLPAAVTASPLGLQLGILAKPSMEALTIPGESLQARGIEDASILNIVYPNGETTITLYTGGSLQIPSLSYPSGAYVAIQPVETRITCTSIGKTELYSQIASTSKMLENTLGRVFAEKLVETLLLNSLTDTQALDTANELAKNTEWLKTLSEQKRIDAAKKITEYVKKGETAEEATQRVKQESEEYVKNVKLEIIAFLQAIGDSELAKEVADLLDCIRRNIPDGIDAAKWLLDLLKRIHGQAGNTGLRTVIEKAFKYPESVAQGCTLASSIVNQLMKKSIAQAWEELNRIINYPDGIRLRCVLTQHKENLRIRIPREQIKQYLGEEPCWIKIEAKGRVFYKNYGPTFDWDLPGDLGIDGEEVEIAITKTTTYEFVKAVLRGAEAPFDIAFSPGKYELIVGGRSVCEILLEEDMHYDKTGDYGPAVIFAIKDYDGKKHLIKLVHKESKKFLSKIMISQYREIRSVKYEEERSRLIIEYYMGVGETTSEHEVFLESLKTVLMRMVEEVRDLINEGVPRNNSRVTGLVGKIGQDYTRFHLEEEIKEIASRITGIPKEELRVFQGYQTEGPDFYVYHKTGLVAIVEVKTTTVAERYPGRASGCLYEGVEQLMVYFTKEKWMHLRKAKFGIPIAIYLEDLDKIIIRISKAARSTP